jgi:hypothetical protein
VIATSALIAAEKEVEDRLIDIVEQHVPNLRKHIACTAGSPPP